MNFKMYVIRDSKATFDLPFTQHTHGEAERTFRQMANDKQSKIMHSPEDYDLYYLGDYNQETGTITALSSPQHMLKAINAVQQ